MSPKPRMIMPADVAPLTADEERTAIAQLAALAVEVVQDWYTRDIDLELDGLAQLQGAFRQRFRTWLSSEGYELETFPVESEPGA